MCIRDSIRGARVAVKNAATSLRSAALRRKLSRHVAKQRLAKLDYIEYFDPKTLETDRRVGRGTHMALAVFFGKTRLIDNGRL